MHAARLREGVQVMNAKDEKRRFTEMNRSYGTQL
jgi:hypothetical protein